MFKEIFPNMQVHLKLMGVVLPDGTSIGATETDAQGNVVSGIDLGVDGGDNVLTEFKQAFYDFLRQVYKKI